MTKNRNYVQGRSYIIFNDIPESIYYLQKFNLPGFSIPEASQSTPYQNIPIPGSTVKYNDFNCTFICDEEYKVWYELFQWMKKNNHENLVSDFTLYLYSNTAKKLVMKIDFIGAWCSLQNDINEFFNSSTNDDTTPKLIDILFKYAYYDPKLISENTNSDIIIGVE